MSRKVPKWIGLCFAGVFVIVLAMIPRDTVQAEPPTGSDMVLVPKDDMERLAASHAAMLERISDLEKMLRAAAGRAEICTATWGGFRG